MNNAFRFFISSAGSVYKNIQGMYPLASLCFSLGFLFSSFLAALHPVPPYMRTCTMNLFRLSLFATCYTFTVAKMILSLSVMSEL